MHYWRFLIGVLAVIEAVASFSGHNLIDVHHQCSERRERDSALTRLPLSQLDRVTTKAEALGHIRKVHEREDFRRQGTERARDFSDYRRNSVSLRLSNRPEFSRRRRIESRSSHEDRRITAYAIKGNTARITFLSRNTRSVDRIRVIRSEPSIRRFESTLDARRNTDHVSERSERTSSPVQHTRHIVRDNIRVFEPQFYINDRRLTRDRSNEHPTKIDFRSSIAGDRGLVSTTAISAPNERRLHRDQTYERSARIYLISRGAQRANQQFSQTVRKILVQQRSRSIDEVHERIANTRSLSARKEDGGSTSRLGRFRSTRNMAILNTRSGDHLKNNIVHVVHDRRYTRHNMQPRVLSERIYPSSPVVRQNDGSSDTRERKRIEPETTVRIRDEIHVVNRARRSLSADHRPQPTDSRMDSYLERDNVIHGIRESGGHASRTNLQDQRRREALRRNIFDENKLSTKLNARNHVGRNVERKQTERRETFQRTEKRNDLQRKTRNIDNNAADSRVSKIRSYRSPLSRTERLSNTMNRMLGADHRDDLLAENNFRYRRENANRREQYSEIVARRTIQALSRPSKLVADDNASHSVAWKTLIVTALQGIYISAIIFQIASGSSLKGSKNKIPGWVTFQPTSSIKAD